MDLPGHAAAVPAECRIQKKVHLGFHLSSFFREGSGATVGPESANQNICMNSVSRALSNPGLAKAGLSCLYSGRSRNCQSRSGPKEKELRERLSHARLMICIFCSSLFPLLALFPP